MNEKPDVLQGSLALMVLKTLNVLGQRHGCGTLYPLLLKLEHEGSIVSEGGTSENNRRARFYRLTVTGRKQRQTETPDCNQTAATIARFFEVNAEDLP
jgi:DNA-binding PadR family transcriptional regulator